METLEMQRKRVQEIHNHEGLFIRLSLVHTAGSSGTKELMEEGFLQDDYSYTPKAYEFKQQFYNQNKEAVYDAIKSYGNTKERQMVKEASGFKDYFAFELFAEQLVMEDRLVKNPYGTYYAK